MTEPGEGEGLNIDEAVSSGSFRAEKLPREFGEMLDLASERDSYLIVTRRGKMAALVVPMTAPEAFRRYLENDPLRVGLQRVSGESDTEFVGRQIRGNPDFAEQLRAAVAEGGVPVDQVFGSSDDDLLQTGEIETSYEAIEQHPTTD